MVDLNSLPIFFFFLSLAEHNLHYLLNLYYLSGPSISSEQKTKFMAVRPKLLVKVHF